MKKFYFKLCAVAMAMIIFQLQVSTNAFAAGTSTVTDDVETEIYGAFSDIDGLVAFLGENEGVTYNELEAFNSMLIENVSSSAAIALNAASEGEPPVLSAFLWGCIFSWVGLIVVYVTTDSNKAYTSKAWSGCLVNAGCYVLSSVLYAIVMSAGMMN
jgi:hypothetical protein